LIRRQPERIVLGAVLGSASFSIPTLAPYVLSRAVDDGLVPGDMPTLLLWAIALLGVGCLNAWLGIMRHRTNDAGPDGRQPPHGPGDRGARRPARSRTPRPGRHR
jgi:hypothetical protein